MRIKVLGIILMFIVFIAACRDDDENPPTWGELNDHIFVLNEGNFGSSNASITAVSRETGSMWNDIFSLVNDFQLGDVVQSMTIHNDKAYIVVNNSGKIEVADATTLESIATIDGLTSPRYFLPINDDKAYVSNFVFAGTTTLDVIDLNTNTVSKTIPTAWGEQMVISNGKVFVGIMNSREVLVIDSSTDTVIDTVAVAFSPNSLQVDKNGQVWVLSDGGFYGEDIPTLQSINPTTLAVEQTFTFTNSDASPTKLAINSAGDQLYFLDIGNVWKFDITAGALPSEPFVSETDITFYGLGIDPKTDRIYAADAGDNISRGNVIFYEADGTPIDGFEVGIIPGGFCFN